MRILPLSEVKAKLSGLVKELELTQEEVYITRKGRAAAVLVSADEWASHQETTAVKADKALMREIRKGARAKNKRTYTLDGLFEGKAKR